MRTSNPEDWRFAPQFGPWTLMPGGPYDVDWVDGPEIIEPVEVVPRSDAEALAEALEAVNLVNPPAALAEYRSRHPKETP